jgi:hypothetical protein
MRALHLASGLPQCNVQYQQSTVSTLPQGTSPLRARCWYFLGPLHTRGKYGTPHYTEAVGRDIGEEERRKNEAKGEGVKELGIRSDCS